MTANVVDLESVQAAPASKTAAAWASQSDDDLPSEEPPDGGPAANNHSPADTESSERPAVHSFPSDNAEQHTSRDLKASLVDAGGYSVMVGAGETYFGPFALAIGLSAAGAGLMVTVPVLLGATLQLCTPWMVRWIGSHRLWIVSGALLQVGCLTTLAVAGWLPHEVAVGLVALTITLYWAGGLSGGPPWNTWIEDVVPSSVRTHFFATRQRLSQFCLLLSFVVAGISLDEGKKFGVSLWVFTGLFALAAAARAISGTALALQSEPRRGKYEETTVPWQQLFRGGSSVSSGQTTTAGGGGALVLYLLAMQVGVQFSGPYFAPFVLREEGMSYLSFMVLFSLGILAKAVSMPWWGRFSQAWGPRRLLGLGGVAIIPLSALWVLCDCVPDLTFRVPAALVPEAWSQGAGELRLSGQFLVIAMVQIISGIAWSAYELGMSLMFLHGIPRTHRTSLLTWYNFGNALAMVTGSLLGAWVLHLCGENHSTYMLIFWTASVIRLCTIALLVRVG
jgi:MFS family permease